MTTTLKAGDRVLVNAGIKPTLTFTITGIITTADQLLACGEYGCFAIDLLQKIETEPAPDSPIQ
ncbi:hypothetical protein GCM10027592_56610 [Spirosoma flavus]